ncbi:MAG: NADH-quinone oxidoreductase subunit C [Chloroflexi bacterium]|nr:NADH-quinone oxidoreductase subunit C [Chloroflexota bacterium]
MNRQIMTTSLSGQELSQIVSEAVPDSVAEWNERDIFIKPESWLKVARLLKEKAELDFAFLNAVTVVDYIEFFEVVYHLTSLRHNHSAVIKMRCYGREEPAVPSVVSIWQGADFQEREAWDLMGVRFDGHPNLKRIMLWEGFPGHPQRKDFLR